MKNQLGQHQEQQIKKNIYHFSSRRKIQPLSANSMNDKSLRERVWGMEEQDCHSVDANMQKWIEIQHNWILHEYFYSHCEWQYYHDTAMQQILNELGFTTLNYRNFKRVQSSLPKPYKFDSQFVRKEREKLPGIRKQKILNNQKKQKMEEYLKQIRLTAGTTVWALHPNCGHLHPGTLLTQYKQDIFVIKFLNPLLGTVKVNEELISADFMRSQTLREAQKKNLSIMHINSVDQCDLQAFTIFRSLLEIKKVLMHNLKLFHDLAEQRNIDASGLDDQQLQQYGWIGSMIAIINIVLKYLRTSFCIFDNTSSTQQKGPKLPILDLSQKYGGSLNMSEEINEEQNESFFSKNNSSPQGNADKEQYLQQIYKKYQPILDMQGKKQMKQVKKILKNCLGVLCGLQEEGKNYNIAKDKFMDGLRISGNDKFMQINSQLKELMAKIQ